MLFLALCLIFYPYSSVALGAKKLYLGNGHGGGHLDYLAFLSLPFCLSVFFNYVNAFNNNLAFLWQDLNDFACS